MALYVTWGLFQGEGALVAESVHMEIRRGMSEQLTQAIIKARPEAYNVEVLDFWTEAVTEKEIKAHFSFEFEEESSLGGESKIQKKASAVIRKIETEEEESQVWRAEELNLEGQIIQFKKGLTIETAN